MFYTLFYAIFAFVIVTKRNIIDNGMAALVNVGLITIIMILTDILKELRK